jgi:hypothetical protein
MDIIGLISQKQTEEAPDVLDIIYLLAAEV